MKKDILKNNIVRVMKADLFNRPKMIDNFIMLLAEDSADVNNLEYFFTIYDAMSELENENVVEDVSGLSGKNLSILEKLKKTQWKLKNC